MRRAGRILAWAGLAGAAALLAGSAVATPMNNLDYATKVQIEVDLQNMTCSDLDYLWHVLDEMTGTCRPALSTYPIYTPPRTCVDNRVPTPTYRLTPEFYQTLGPAQRAYLAQAGIPWDVDAQTAELRGASRSTTQFFFSGPVNALFTELGVAAKLRNCHSF